MGKGGRNRDWGYASYDVDNPDDERLTYTSFEKDGRVNRYTDNGDGGHSHEKWNNKEDYIAGKDPDWGRSESGKSKNPTTGELQENGDCFLTTACMHNYKNNFDDHCYELEVLRWFRDQFVSKEDIEYYYAVAPIIIEAIEHSYKKSKAYAEIYQDVIRYCVKEIEKQEYVEAYQRYKDSVLKLEEQYARPDLVKRLLRTMKK